MSTITTAELRREDWTTRDEPSSTSVRSPPTTAGAGMARPAAATSRGRSPSRPAWLRIVDEAEIRRLLDEKGITADRDVVVYGDGAGRRRRFVASLPIGIPARAPTRMGPRPGPRTRRCRLIAFPTTSKLVHIPWLRDRPRRGDAEAPPNEKFLLFHVNFGSPRNTPRAHPGRALPRHELARGSRRLEPALARRIEAALARSASPTTRRSIVYGRDTEGDAKEKWPGRRAGQIAATRAAMILRYAGVDDVRLLDGGYDWWVRGGNPLETVERRPTPVASFGVTDPGPPEVIVDIDERRRRSSPTRGRALVSVRTWREHIGAVSGYNYIGPAGRIKGDVWGNCGTDAYHMQHYRNIDNTMRPTRRSRPTGTRPGSRPTSGSPSTAAPAGEPARPGSTRTSRAGSGSRSTTAAGSNGARIRSTTRSRSACRRPSATEDAA
jgi:thiosulfate/3-mercaptopyruvate sulfurtransferase